VSQCIVIEPQISKTFEIQRAGEVDIILTGTHLAQVEEIEGRENRNPRRRICLYRTSAGKYVLACSGADQHDWAYVCDSALDTANYLLDRDGYLGPLEKLLLVEAGKRDQNIDKLARVDLRADAAADIVRSVERASEVVDSAHLSDYLRRIEENLDKDPAQAIGSAKDLLEAVVRLVLQYQSSEKAPDDSRNLGQLMKVVFKSLNLAMEDIPDAKRGTEAIRRVFNGLSQIVEGTAELRNLYGTGHGRVRRSGVSARHARLVVGSAATLCRFLLETLDVRKATANSKGS
jgi:hypothetical protein